MTDILFLAPAKHFILGEYTILDAESEALLFSHDPCFSLKAKKGELATLDGIHPQSPAGKFYQFNKNLFANYQIFFSDPYQQIGGLGASSAQFLLLYRLKCYLENKAIHLDELLKNYHEFSFTTGTPPSGADLISQFISGICHWKKPYSTQSYTWPFSDFDIHFIHTHHKIATHDHLSTLLLPKDLTPFKSITKAGINALAKKNSQEFFNAINEYKELLSLHNLTATHTLKMLNTLSSYSWVKASKGCGALGSDVLLVITDKHFQEPLQHWAKHHGLSYLCNQHALHLEKGVTA